MRAIRPPDARVWSIARRTALDVGQTRAAGERRVDFRGVDVVADAEVSGHRSLGVGRHEHQAAPGGRPVAGGDAGEGDACRPNVVGEHPAQRVVAHRADEGGTCSEQCHADGGVGRRATGYFDGRPHLGVQLLAEVDVNEAGCSLLDPEGVHQIVSGVRQHVDDGVPDTHDIARRFAHRAGVRRWSNGSCR